LFDKPFKISSGVRMPEIRKVKTAIRNSTDGLAQLLYKAMISKTMVVNTIKDAMLIVMVTVRAEYTD
jgi:hypothetical protein